MAYNMRANEGFKKKRGRPPKKVVFDEILDTPTSQASDAGGDIVPEPPILGMKELLAIRQSKHEKKLKAQNQAFKQRSDQSQESTEGFTIPETLIAKETEVHEKQEELEQDAEAAKECKATCKETLAEETIEELVFSRGKNTLSLKFSRKGNRHFIINILLNGTIELRPATYVTLKQAQSFWSMLKGTIR